MITVIKRSGREEPFDLQKIKNSVAAASDEFKLSVNASDLNHLAAGVQELLLGKEKITSREVYDILIGVMKREGFTDLAEAYVKDATNAWQ